MTTTLIDSPAGFLRRLLPWAAVGGALWLLSGCATAPTAIPADYTKGDREIQVVIKKIPEKGKFRDSGSGGLFGAIAGAVRQGGLRDKMEGIQGGTVRDLLVQALNRNLEEHFFVVDQDKDMVAEFEIFTWGWFLPTGMWGIKTGGYQFEVAGNVKVFDRKGPNPQEPVAAFFTIAQEPIGPDPTPERLQELMTKTADKFAQQTIDVLLNRKQPSAPAR